MGSRHVVTHHPPRILEVLAEIHRDSPFESRMELAIAATDVLLGAVVFPVGRRVKVSEGLVMAIPNQVKGALPALRIARGRGPGTAQQVAFAYQIVEVDRRIYNLVIVGQF